MSLAVGLSPGLRQEPLPPLAGLTGAGLPACVQEWAEQCHLTRRHGVGSYRLADPWV